MTIAVSATRAVPYAVTDRSVLLGLYKRVLWDRLVTHIPRGITPNTLTVAAQVFGGLSVAFALVASRGPHRLYAAAALCIFVSLTLDNVDGAHARRTGQSSPRGELLDHGLDGLTSTSVLVSTGLLLHLDALWMGALCALGALTFAATFWEQSRTGVLTLPAIGPTEGVSALVVVELLVSLLGDPAWLGLSRERVTPGAILVLILVGVHAVALAPPLVRAHRQGVSLRGLALLFAVVVLLLGYALVGAPGPLVGGAIGLTCAHFVCGLVIARNHAIGPDGGQSSDSPRWLPSTLAPMLPLLLVPRSVGAATACALVSLLFAAAAYATTVRLGWRMLAPRDGARARS